MFPKVNPNLPKRIPKRVSQLLPCQAMDVQLSAQQAAMIARDVVLGVEAFENPRWFLGDFWEFWII